MELYQSFMGAYHIVMISYDPQAFIEVVHDVHAEHIVRVLFERRPISYFTLEGIRDPC